MMPWEILGIDEDADKRDIKRAYGKLIKTHRPDESPEQFQLIRSAYEHMLASLDNPSTGTKLPSEFSISPPAQAENKTVSAATAPKTQQAEASTAHTSAPPAPVIQTDAEPDPREVVAREANEFIASFQELIDKFPASGKLSNQDLAACRQETMALMKREVLNHWHAREYISATVFEMLCQNIAISTGLFSTTTNFPDKFLQYLDSQFLWSENEVELCELCEDDSAALVFHVIHEGRKNSKPDWSDLPEPDYNTTGNNTTSNSSWAQKIGSLFNR